MWNEKLKHLPDDPGVYLMKDRSGKIIYVGKAKNLKHRVKSYFAGEISKHTPKTQNLVRDIHDFEVMLVKTEVEALLLERTLIKHHGPHYNILLRDDKEYPYIRVDLEEPWPRLTKVRKRKNDKALYIGPFGYTRDLYQLISLVMKIFPLVRCGEHEFQNATRPCHYYHMKKCLGPCTLPVNREVYLGIVQDAIDFLRGQNKEVMASLKLKMKEASHKEDFEIAMIFRDQIQAIENQKQTQAVIIQGCKNADVLGIAENGNHMVFHLLMIRDGKLISKDHVSVPQGVDSGPEALSSFLVQYYEHREVPDWVVIPMDLPNAKDLELVLKGERSKQKMIRSPSYLPREMKDLLKISERNAQYALEEQARASQSGLVVLELVQHKLSLSRMPRRMECIDISNFGEDSIVASNVCFIDGKPSKKNYRLFNIRSVEGKPDDFASMYEAVSRRLAQTREGKEDPFDLLVIDGGKGQLASAKKAFEDSGDENLGDLVSLAKSHVLNTGELEANPIHSDERIYFVDQTQKPYVLVPGRPESRILTFMRDEAHRFAITHHRRRRGKKSVSSSLDDIKGIGPALKKKLLEKFFDVDGIRSASLEDLQTVKGVSLVLAQRLLEGLGG